MLKALVPSLLLVGAIASVQAADPAPAQQSVLGFEFGVGYHLFTDSRYNGTDSNFALVLPIGTQFDAILYHEVGRYYGKDTVAGAPVSNNVDADVNEIRFRVAIWTAPTNEQEVRLMLGMGYAAFTSDTAGTDSSAPVIDFGVNFVAMRKTSGPVKAEVAVKATYRYARFPGCPMLTGAKDVDDLGGFIFGLGAGLFF
jgi:hypothetical protein